MDDIREDVRNGIAGEIATMELDRNGENWSSSFLYDMAQPIRVKGPSIFLISVADIGAPCEQRAVHRWLSLSERFRLQGHSGRTRNLLQSDRVAMRATGNAFAVPMLASMVLPLIEQAVNANVLTNPRKQPKTVAELIEMAASKRRRLG